MISIAFSHIDDDIIEAVDTLRNRKTRNHWKRWSALAACLCLLVSASIIFFQGFPILGAKSGASLGQLVGGSYYYKTDFNFYKYTAGERERLMSTFYVRDVGWLVDDYGLYYIKGRSLYIREHDTGRQRVLYTAESELYFRDDSDGLVTGANGATIGLGLADLNDEFGNHYRDIDKATGEVVRQWGREETMPQEYRVGELIFTFDYWGEDGMYDLYLDGEPFFIRSDNEYVATQLTYYGENLLIYYCKYVLTWGEQPYGMDWVYAPTGYEGNILVKPNGEIVSIPFENYLCGTNDYLIFVGKESPDNPQSQILYSYNVKTMETVLLYDGEEMYVNYALTDGTWLFAFVPWGKTDCWKLVYDTAGKLTGLELFEADI